MTDYKPGTVAVATVLGEPNVRVFRLGDVDDVGDWALDRDIDGLFFSDIAEDKDVTDIRPLVVLDLDGAPDDIATWGQVSNYLRGNLSKTAHWLAGQIEAQTKPPRIPEPGLWGVVEDGEGRRYVRETTDEHARGWNPIGSKTNVTWREIVDPVLVREGVEG